MTTKYPAQIDNSVTLPPASDNLTPVSAKTVNDLRSAIISIQSELGTKPSGTSSTVKNKLVELENAFIGGGGGISLSGDLGGNPMDIKVIGIQSIPVSNTTPTTGQVLKYNGTQYVPDSVAPTNSSYLTLTSDGALSNERVLTAGANVSFVDGGPGNALTINVASSAPSDATTEEKGIIRLNGNLGGTAASPIVTGIRTVTIGATAPINGQVLTAVSESTAAWQTPNPAIGDASTDAKGIIRLAGNLAGNATTPIVTGIRAVTVSSSAPVTGQALIATSESAASWQTISSPVAGSATPNALSSTTGSVGVATAYSRQDHTHPHGDLTGGTLHAVANGTTNGFMSSTDFTKLAAVPTPANILTTSTAFSGTDLAGTFSTGTVKGLTGNAGLLTISSNLYQIDSLGSSGSFPGNRDYKGEQNITPSTLQIVLSMSLLASKAQRFDATVIITSNSDTAKIATLDVTRLITLSGGVFSARNHAVLTDVADDANSFGLTYTIAISGSNITIGVTTATTGLRASTFATLRSRGV